MEGIEYDEDQEELLSLSLAINDQRKRKRNRKSLLREIINLDSTVNITHKNPYNIIHAGEYRSGFEEKVFRVLHVREQMFKRDQLLQKKISILVEQNQDRDRNPTGMHLIHLLLVAATAAAGGEPGKALASLAGLYSGASLTGDSVQRVVAHFADGLAARLFTRRSPFFDAVTKAPTADEEFSAFINLYRVSPFYQFAHFTANQAIIEAFELEQEGEEHTMNDRSLHVIDFEVSYGFQWPSLVQSLAEKASGEARVISLRLTGLGPSQDELRETENRLVSFAKPFRNLSFEFRGVLRADFDDLVRRLERRDGETVAVNLAFHSNNVVEASMSETLRLVRERLRPSVVVLVERDSSVAARKSFLPRFVESLHFFAAMFDSLDECLPRGSAERLGIETHHLGREIRAAMLSGGDGGDDRTAGERSESWKERMVSHGFGGIGMSSKALIQAKLLLKMRAQHCCFPQVDINGGGGGFRVFERDEGMAISLAWQNRCLVTASVWR